MLAGSTNSTSSINDVEPGLLGFLVVAALGLALVFLLRSMNKQFKKIAPDPDEADEADEASADEARPGAAHRDGDGDGATDAARPGATGKRAARS